MHIRSSLGFNHEPLSRIPLEVFDSEAKEKAVIFSDELRHQHGSDVLCLPYTQTPFPLLDAARSLSLRQATIAEDFRLDPLSLQEDFVSVRHMCDWQPY